MSVSLDSALPERRATRRSFDRATRLRRRELRSRRDAAEVARAPRSLRSRAACAVDLGCATGRGALALAARYPAGAACSRSTRAPACCARRRERCRGAPSVAALGGDAERLPLRSQSRPARSREPRAAVVSTPTLFAEAARVLVDGGLLLFATLGPDSLAGAPRAPGVASTRRCTCTRRSTCTTSATSRSRQGSPSP